MSVSLGAVVGFFEDVLVGLQVDVDLDLATWELGDLLQGPWAGYCSGRRPRGSALTDSGAPFELSVKLTAGGSVSVRYVVDVADVTLDVGDNQDRYLDAARRVTGQPAHVLRQLFSCHLEDAAPGTPATVMHGVGWASGGRRRSTLYFPTSWLTPTELADRLPGPVSFADRTEVVGYDFGDAGLSSWKTYHWFPVGATPLQYEPGFAASRTAAAIHDRFGARLAPGVQATSTFLQRRTPTAAAPTAALFFFARPWGFAIEVGMPELLGLLASLGWDLRTLRIVAAASRQHELPLHIGLVAASTDDRSLTFYFWPS
jgi:hypothetical protein